MVARLMTNLSIGLMDWALEPRGVWCPRVRTDWANRPAAGVRAARSSATAKNPIVKILFIVLIKRRKNPAIR
jgi:hypothetical protein